MSLGIIFSHSSLKNCAALGLAPFEDTAICNGDSIYLENAYRTVAGTYYDTLQSVQGWDSIINTHLEILPILPAPTITEDTGVLISSSASNYQWYLNDSLITGATAQDYQPSVSGVYQVAIEDTNGCLSFSEKYNFAVVGINELEKDFIIYPNPIKDKLYIDSDKDFEVEVAAPGLNKKDFKVEVENNVLTISAEKKEEKTEKKQCDGK